MTRTLYWILLATVSLFVLVGFVSPTDRHSGLNDYFASEFLEMVDGTAHRPYVTRALLPAAVRVVRSAVSPDAQESLRQFVERELPLRRLFARFHWETRGTFEYLFACLLMWLCFVFFADAMAGLALDTGDLPATLRYRSLLAAGALLILPAFWWYTSFVYDPPQMLLFALALRFLWHERWIAFAVVFIISCLNKETAVLLLPIAAWDARQRGELRERLPLLLGLGAWWLLVRGGIAWGYRGNAGSAFEFSMAHNIGWLTRGWTLTALVNVAVLALLAGFRWSEKPALMRTALLWTVVPIAVSGMFLGQLDEWRIYYEAYPAFFALAVDTLFCFAFADRYRALR